MANLYPPDSKLNQPELFYPGRKPVGKVKIDWSHPLTKGLVLCCPFNEPSFINLVDGSIPDQDTGSLYFIHVEPFKSGMAGGSPEDRLLNGLIWDIKDISDFTFLTDMYYGEPTFSRTAGVANSSGDNYVHYISTATAWRSLNSGYSASAMNVAIPSKENTRGVGGFSGDSDSGTTGFFNEQVGTGATWSSSNVINKVWYGINSGSHGLAFFNYIGIYILCVWDRALSVDEMVSFKDNPYQFLIPDRG